MHILAWIMVITLGISILFIFWYTNYTAKGKIEQLLRPTKIKPISKWLFIGSIAYLFYYYFGL